MTMLEKAREPESMLDRMDFAMSQVAIVATTAGGDDGNLRWAVWDQNQDTDEVAPTIVFLGGLYDPDKDRLEKPPGPVLWAHRRAVVRAALAAIRLPDEMLQEVGLRAYCTVPSEEPISKALTVGYTAMIDAILAEKAE